MLKNNKKKVYLINNKYILKKDSRERLLAENIFLSLYKKKEVERVIFYKKNSSYAIYEYQKEDILNIESKENILQYIRQIKKFIDNYIEYKCYGYGDILNRVDSWRTFLEKEINEKSKFMDIEKNEIIKNSLNIVSKYKFKKKVIHGDLGIYNVIFQNDKIKIVIDPRTIIGDPLFDFIYFILSKRDFIENMNIDNFDYDLPYLNNIHYSKSLYYYNHLPIKPADNKFYGTFDPLKEYNLYHKYNLRRQYLPYSRHILNQAFPYLPDKL